MTSVRILQPGDEDLVARFCARHPDTTVFFHSNMLAAGLADGGQRLQGTYAAAIDDGQILALASHDLPVRGPSRPDVAICPHAHQ